MDALREFTLTLKDVAKLIMLPMFKETNHIRVVLEEKGEMTLKYSSYAMTASKTSGKSSYAIWARFFDEGGVSKND